MHRRRASASCSAAQTRSMGAAIVYCPSTRKLSSHCEAAAGLCASACGSGAPVPVRIVGADDRDLLCRWWWRLDHVVGHKQLPAGVGANRLDGGARMVTAQKRFARVGVEPEYGQIGHDRSGPPAGAAGLLAPLRAIAVAGRGEEADAGW